MKLTLKREDLLKPLQSVMGVVEHKQAMPILSNVLLKITNDGLLSVMGTDTEIELVGQTRLENNLEAAYITLPARKLFDICKALPENALIKLMLENDRILLHSDRSRFSLATLPTDEFPNIEVKPADIKFTIKQRDLRNLLQKTYFAIAQQDIRYYLNGMLLELHSNKIRVVATDGHRLAINSLLLPELEIGEQQHSIIIPRKAVAELQRLLHDTDQEIEILMGNNYIRAGYPDHYIFTSRLIEGLFPNYQQVIPRGGDKVVLLNREILKRALQRSAILCNENLRIVYFDFKKDLLRISANNSAQELAEEEISIQYPFEEEVNIGFNVNYLLDVLNNIDTEEVQFTFSNYGRGMLIEEPNNENSLFVIMPMRM